jgi:hypothetical protein
MSVAAPERIAMWGGVLGGIALGAFLGFLIGLSTTPVVSIVITGVMALLGTFFGLSNKLAFSISEDGPWRLCAFGIAASLCMFWGMYLRTHQSLMPSIDEQKADLRKLGYADNTKEQTAMLAYLRYGVSLPGATAPTPGGGVLYALPNLCPDLSKAHEPADMIRVLGEADNRLKTVADKIKTFTTDQQGSAADVAKSILCPPN